MNKLYLIITILFLTIINTSCRKTNEIKHVTDLNQDQILKNHYTINGNVVSALESGNFQRNESENYYQFTLNESSHGDFTGQQYIIRVPFINMFQKVSLTNIQFDNLRESFIFKSIQNQQQAFIVNSDMSFSGSNNWIKVMQNENNTFNIELEFTLEGKYYKLNFEKEFAEKSK